jgi:erythromycin esterase
LIGIIGNAHVVQLGEGTHGDGTAFLLRTRIVRCLHAQLGFEALAFESGFFECRAVQSALRAETIDLRDAISLGVYPIWAESRQMLPLFEYLRSTSATALPLAFLGFDVQASRPTIREDLPRGLNAFIVDSHLDSMSTSQVAQLDDMLRTVLSAGQFKIDAETHQRNTAVLADLRHALGELGPEQRFESAWWEQVLSSLQHNEQSAFFGSLAPPFDPTHIEATTRSPFRIMASNARDLGMAENLSWWLNVPGHDAGLIVWAANSHVAHDSRRVAVAPLPGEDHAPVHASAGSHLRQRLGDSLYTFLTITYKGRWAAPSIRTSEGALQWTHGQHPPAAKGSLAELLHRSGMTFGVLDLRALSKEPEHWLNQPLVIRQDRFHGEAIVLADYCDGILFIDEMEPSAPHGSAPR